MTLPSRAIVRGEPDGVDLEMSAPRSSDEARLWRDQATGELGALFLSFKNPQSVFNNHHSIGGWIGIFAQELRRRTVA